MYRLIETLIDTVKLYYVNKWIKKRIMKDLYTLHKFYFVKWEVK